MRWLALVLLVGAVGCIDFDFDFDFRFESPDANPCGGHGDSIETLNDCSCPLKIDITSALDRQSCDTAKLACSGGWFGTTCTCESGSLRWYCGGADLSLPTVPLDLGGTAE